MLIKLIRHGESKANTGELDAQQVGDYSIGLTERGRQQSAHAGQTLGANFLTQALIYCSPYYRTRETLHHLLLGAGLDPAAIKVYEDPRLREVEHGYANIDAQQELRRIHGWFYYRYKGGESPADCYDRTSSFLESMMRQAQRSHAQRILIVTHGLTIRCFVMRFLHLRVEQFEIIKNPANCEVITISDEPQTDPQFVTGRWSVTGLHLRR